MFDEWTPISYKTMAGLTVMGIEQQLVSMLVFACR
jgi:hypothetical protein